MPCWLPDGRTIVAAFIADTYVLDVDSGEVLRHFVGGGGGRECSHDGTLMAYIDGRVLNLESGTYQDLSLPQYLQEHFVEGYAASWSPGDRFLAVNESDHTVRIWEFPTNELVAELDGGMSRGSGYYGDSVAWSPDGSLLAAASEDGIVRIWSAPDFQLRVVIEGFDSAY